MYYVYPCGAIGYAYALWGSEKLEFLPIYLPWSL